MTWSRNPRTLTKEQFSTGTTIDGDRIDNALDDVVERVNDIPYGDLRKRWVPITYVAGWTPQSPRCLSDASPEPTSGSNPSSAGGIYATHHWPWLRVRNRWSEVAENTEGHTIGSDVRPANPYRLKGASVPGISPFGTAEISTTKWKGATVPIGQQYAWTRSWFIEPPSILDSIDLVLEIDHASSALANTVFSNDFGFDAIRPPAYPDANARDLVIVASVDNEFAREDRNLSDVEVLRKGFVVSNDAFSPLPLPKDSSAAPTYADMTPSVDATLVGSTLQGVHIQLKELNIPIHQNARIRVSVVIPSYTDGTGITPNYRPNGWNPNNFSADYPWLQQKIHMAVTMLEEVTSG